MNVQVAQQTPLGRQRGEGLGSGVIYREDGYVITNNHVVEGASAVSVSFADGTTERAEVVGADPNTEIAVLRVDRDGLPAASFNEDELLVGQLAVAIGSPSGFEATVTSGVVSAVGREFPPSLPAGIRRPPARSSISSRPTRPSPRATQAAPWPTATARSSVSTLPTCRPRRRVP